MSKGGKRTTTSSATSNPIVPTSWTSNYDATMGGLRGLTEAPALNDNQTAAAGYFSGNLNRSPISIAPAPSIAPLGVSTGNVNAGSITPQSIVASLATGSQAEAMNPYGVSEASYDPFTGRRGNEFTKDYLDPMMSEYVGAALGDYDVGGERAMAAERARRGAGAAFGTGADVADAIRAGEISRGRGVLSGQLRGDAYKTALTAGMADADRLTNVAGANAANRLAADTFNAGARNAAAANAFSAEAARRANNATLSQNAGQFNAGQTQNAAMQNAANRLSADTTNAGNALTASQANAANALTASQSNAANRLSADTTNAANALRVGGMNADLSLANDDFTMRNALGLANMGGEEFRQRLAPWELVLQGLNTGTSTFGNQSSGTQTERYRPGVFDWASLGGSILASPFGGQVGNLFGGGPTPIDAAGRVAAINKRYGW